MGDDLDDYDAGQGSAQTVAGLIDAFAEAIAIKVEKIAGTPQRLMEVDDAAKYLGMTVHALRKKAGVEIPCIRFDGKLRFDKRELDRRIDRANREGV
jgi:hypothetical protein